MKIPIIDKTGKKVSEVNFGLKAKVRDDIFKKAVFAENSLFFQTKGSDEQAGKKAAINVSKRRKKLRSTYGKGGSRTPKKVMWSRGVQFRFVGAWASNTVGGRRAHPPKAQKNTLKTMNNKEWSKAVLSGLIASFTKDVVSANGAKLPENYPIVLDSNVESLNKTKDVKDFLTKLGFGDEIQRTSEVKIRAGRGTMRGRATKVKRGPLVVVSSLEAPLLKAVRNIKGFDVITSDLLMASDFGMSEKPGRAVLFTKEALAQFEEVIGGNS